MPNSRKVKVIKRLAPTPVKPKPEMPAPPGSLEKKTAREIARQVNAWVVDLRERKMHHSFFAPQG